MSGHAAAAGPRSGGAANAAAAPVSAPRVLATTATATEGETPQILQAFADDSPHVSALRSLSATLNRGPHVTQLQAVARAMREMPHQPRAPLRPESADHSALAHPAQGVVQRVNWEDVRHNVGMRIEKIGADFVAFAGDQRVGELDLYEDDDDRQWINNISVDEARQGQGIGLALLNAAVTEYGAIYAATGMTRTDAEDDEDDTRYLSVEGAALVRSAVRNNILRPEWCFNPAMENYGDDDRDDEDDNDQVNTGESGEVDGQGDGGDAHFLEAGDQDGDGEGDGADGGDDRDEPLEATCTAIVVLDDEHTNGIGYQYWIELTNTDDGQEITVEYDDIVSGEDDFTTEDLERALSRTVGGTIRLISWEVQYPE